MTVLLNIWRGDDPVFIEASLRSVFAQTRRPDELLIVFDGPIDSEIEMNIRTLCFLNRQNVKYVQIELSKGLWNARNVGLREAANELVVLQDADDIMHPKRIEVQLLLNKDLDFDVVVSRSVEFDSETLSIIGFRPLWDSDEQMFSKFFWNNPICHSSVMLRRSMVLRIGGYKNMNLIEDYDLWIRMIEMGCRFGITDNLLQAIRTNNDQLKRRGGLRLFIPELRLSVRIGRMCRRHLVVLVPIRFVLRMIFRVGPLSFKSMVVKIFVRGGIPTEIKSLSDFYALDFKTEKCN